MQRPGQQAGALFVCRIYDFRVSLRDRQNARTILSTARCVFSGVLKAVRRR